MYISACSQLLTLLLRSYGTTFLFVARNYALSCHGSVCKTLSLLSLLIDPKEVIIAYFGTLFEGVTVTLLSVPKKLTRLILLRSFIFPVRLQPLVVQGSQGSV